MKMKTMGMSNKKEETQLLLAAMKSYHTGKLTPILKEELRYRIQSRRLCEGKEELLAVDFNQNKKPQALRPEEIERNKKRKEQNRKAAAKFRNKKKMEIAGVQVTYSDLEKRNLELRKEVERLQSARDSMYTKVSAILDRYSSTADNI